VKSGSTAECTAIREHFKDITTLPSTTTSIVNVDGHSYIPKLGEVHGRILMTEKSNASYEVTGRKTWKERNTVSDCLQYILEEPAFRQLFHEFLTNNFCEENLAFWLDVEDFKCKFSIASSPTASSPLTSPVPSREPTPGRQVMEYHYKTLIDVLLIYNTYLAPASPCEIAGDHGIRSALTRSLEDVVTVNVVPSLTSGVFDDERVKPEEADTLHTIIRLIEEIQMQTFRLMTDSVPKASSSLSAI
jgi:GTPase-activating protein SST2